MTCRDHTQPLVVLLTLEILDLQLFAKRGNSFALFSSLTDKDVGKLEFDYEVETSVDSLMVFVLLNIATEYFLKDQTELSRFMIHCQDRGNVKKKEKNKGGGVFCFLGDLELLKKHLRFIEDEVQTFRL